MSFKEFQNKYQKKEVQLYPSLAPKKPLVSVCIQTFQHVKYIEQCLEGVLKQETSFEYEVLLGDDASSDGTREICKDYANKYKDKIRLFLHHRDNNIAIDGIPTGRFNFAYNLYKARGKYIAICEGDDFWTDSKKLQKQVDFLEKNSNYVICAHNTIAIKKQNNPKSHPDFEDGNFNSVLIRGLSQDTLSVVFRNKINGFPDWFFKCAMGDYPLYLLLLKDGGKVKYMNDLMGMYRHHKGGMWSSLSKEKTGKKILEALDLINEGFEFKFELQIKEAKKKFSQKFGLYNYSLISVIIGKTPLEYYLMRLRIEIKKILNAHTHNSF